MEKDTSKMMDIISLSFDTSTGELSLTLNLIVFLILIFVLTTVILLWRRWFRQQFGIYDLEVEISGTPKTSFKVQRNTEN